MTPDEIVARLREPQPLPKAALRQAAEQADAVVPRIARVMECVADPDRAGDEDGHGIVFFGVFVIGETGDARAYRPLLKFLAGDPETVDRLLGDALTETVAHVLVRIADDPEPLLDLVGHRAANEYARGAALQAWARVAVETSLPEAEVRDRLAAIYDRLEPAREGYLAAEWCIAAACLGLADLKPQVEHLLASRSGAFFPVYDPIEFDRDLQRQAEQGSRALMDAMRWTPFVSTAVDELSRWAAFRPDTPRYRPGPPGGGMRNPARDVGRNDPCTCGSGRKYKKCCGRT